MRQRRQSTAAGARGRPLKLAQRAPERGVRPGTAHAELHVITGSARPMPAMQTWRSGTGGGPFDMRGIRAAPFSKRGRVPAARLPVSLVILHLAGSSERPMHTSGIWARRTAARAAGARRSAGMAVAAVAVAVALTACGSRPAHGLQGASHRRPAPAALAAAGSGHRSRQLRSLVQATRTFRLGPGRATRTFTFRERGGVILLNQLTARHAVRAYVVEPAESQLDHLVSVYAQPGAFAASIAWYPAGAATVAVSLAERGRIGGHIPAGGARSGEPVPELRPTSRRTACDRPCGVPARRCHQLPSLAGCGCHRHVVCG